MTAYDPERIIAAAIERDAKSNPAALARAILDELWEAGFDVRPRLDEIPIRDNPGTGDNTIKGPWPDYTPADERHAASQKPAELFRQLADEPRNEPIRDKIGEIARKYDGLD